jgi:hypothetical protein
MLDEDGLPVEGVHVLDLLGQVQQATVEVAPDPAEPGTGAERDDGVTAGPRQRHGVHQDRARAVGAAGAEGFGEDSGTPDHRVPQRVEIRDVRVVGQEQRLVEQAERDVRCEPGQLRVRVGELQQQLAGRRHVDQRPDARGTQRHLQEPGQRVTGERGHHRDPQRPQRPSGEQLVRDRREQPGGLGGDREVGRAFQVAQQFTVRGRVRRREPPHSFQQVGHRGQTVIRVQAQCMPVPMLSRATVSPDTSSPRARCCSME